MSFQAISIESMNHVVGGNETACRTVGAIGGGAWGAVANLTPNPVMAAAGAINTATSSLKGDRSIGVDAIATAGSLVPVASIPSGAWTGARIGSRAGALMCGYKP